MSAGPETRLVARIRLAIVARWPAAYVIKTHGSAYMPAGTPDLLVVVAGRAIGLEVKAPRPGERPVTARRRTTLIQRARLRTIAAAGGTAATVLSVEEAIAAVQRAIR